MYWSNTVGYHQRVQNLNFRSGMRKGREQIRLTCKDEVNGLKSVLFREYVSLQGQCSLVSERCANRNLKKVDF